MTKRFTDDVSARRDEAAHPPTAGGTGERHERSAVRVAVITAIATLLASALGATATIVAAWLVSR